MKRQFFALLLASLVSGRLAADTIVWTNTAGGVYSVAANWNPNRVPVASDTVSFSSKAATAYTVALTATVSNNAMTVGSDRLIFDLAGHNYVLTNKSVVLQVTLTTADSAFLTITNSGSASVTNTFRTIGQFWLGYNLVTKLNTGTGTLELVGANVNFDRENDNANIWSHFGTNAFMLVRGGARYSSGMLQRTEFYGGRYLVEGPGTRAAIKFHNLYPGSTGMVSNRAVYAGTNGAITTVHEGSRLTFSDRSRYGQNEVGTLAGGRIDTMNGALEMLGGSYGDFGFRVQIASTAVKTPARLTVDGTDSTLEVDTSATQGFQGVFVGGQNGGTVGGTGIVTVVNGGRILGEVNLFPNGTLQGNGTINVGVGGFNNGGTVKPGWPKTGTLTVQNGVFKMNYTNTTTKVNYVGKIEFVVAGAEAGQYSKLAVSGAITLGGTCKVTLADGYKPQQSATYDILDWTTSRSGIFSTLELQTPCGSRWITDDLYTTGEITYIPPPSGTILLVR
jgi:hypothetical protein